jgi:hypothetical protein
MEVLGEVVDELRARAKAGQPIQALVRQLWELNPDVSHLESHLEAAFFVDGGRPRLRMLPRDDSGAPTAESVEKALGRRIEDLRPRWSEAPPYPDLLCRGHRDAFRLVAQQRKVTIVVKAPHPAARRYLGRPGHAAAPSDVSGVVRATEPNAGLLCADPRDPRLAALLASLQHDLGHRLFVERLSSAGFRVGNASDGYLVRDARGTAFFAPYRVLGIYDTETHADMWRFERGERLRAELNRALGEELIPFPGSDAWQGARGTRALLDADRAPALCFLPDGLALTRPDIESLRDFYKAYQLPWRELDPSEEEQRG